MNKKLFAGISMVAAVSAGFWACGEGNINEMTEMDNVISMQYPLDPATGAAGPELENLKEGALSSCKEDMGCYTQYQGYLEGTEPIETLESSSSEENQGPNTNPTMSSSSRGDVIIVTKPSSSSITVIDGPEPESSADIQITTPTSGLGSCAPASAAIQKGSSVKWKFSGSQTAGYKPMDFAKATFAWSFPGGSPAADATPSTSAAITYASAGDASASLTLTMQDGKSEVIQCSPLRVNGDPILGCSCKSDQKTPKVDVAAGPVTVSWTVACQSTISGWAWTGATGTTATASVELNDKDVVKPTVTVSTEESTLDVECDQVEGYDAATYGKDLDLPYQGQNVPLDAGTYRLTMTYEGWTGQAMGTLTYGTLQIGVNNSCTVTLNGVAKTITNNEAIKNTDELVLLETPANCVTSISAY